MENFYGNVHPGIPTPEDAADAPAFPEGGYDDTPQADDDVETTADMLASTEYAVDTAADEVQEAVPAEWGEAPAIAHTGPIFFPVDTTVDDMVRNILFLEKIEGVDANSITTEVPMQSETGFEYQWQAEPATLDYPRTLAETTLLPDHELAIVTYENALVRLGPGQRGAISTDGIAGCSVAAGIATYADGARLAYASHFPPMADNRCRYAPGGPNEAVTPQLMRRFAEAAVARGGLERLAVAVAQFRGLPNMRGANQPPGVHVGRQLVDDTAAAADALRFAYGAEIVFEQYKIAAAGGHSVTVYLGDGHSTAYFDDKPLIRL